MRCSVRGRSCRRAGRDCSGRRYVLDVYFRCLTTADGDISSCQDTIPHDISSLDRNLEALVQELASMCSEVFRFASGAVARTAQVEVPPDFAMMTTAVVADGTKPKWIRERAFLKDEVCLETL